MKILHISDIHYREHYALIEEGYPGVVYGMTSPLIHLENCFSRINLAEIDGIVITGDLTEQGCVRDYQLLYTFIHKYTGNKPMLVTPGNHDDKNAFREGWCNQEPIQDQEVPCNEVIEIGDKLFISIDNASSLYPNGAFTHDQIKWLQSTLQENDQKEVVIIFHHNLIQTEESIPAAEYNDEFVQLISRNNVKALLCGHTHHHYLGKFHGVLYSTAPSMSFRGLNETENGIVKFEEFPGFQICEFSLQGIKITPFYLEKEPRFIKSIKIGEIKI